MTELVVAVAITNVGCSARLLPLERLAEDPENLAFDIRDSSNNRIEPIDFVMVSPKNLPKLVQLEANRTVKFERRGTIETKNEYLYVAFPRATFRLLKGAPYSIALRWNEFVSERIALVSD